MRKRVQGFIAGVMLAAILTSGTAIAKQVSETAQLVYDNIKIVVNGKEVQPKDANGAYVEPFTIDGTTYLPVRGISSALGLDVEWNDSTKTVVLSNALKAPFTLAAGQYVVGEDIEAGKYDCRAVSGSGSFMGTVESMGFMGLSAVMAEEGNKYYEDDRSTYSNLRLADGDIINISGDLKLEFVKK